MTQTPHFVAVYDASALAFAWKRHEAHPLLALVTAFAKAGVDAAALVSVGDLTSMSYSVDMGDMMAAAVKGMEAAEREAIRVLGLKGEAGAHVLRMARERGGWRK